MTLNQINDMSPDRGVEVVMIQAIYKGNNQRVDKCVVIEPM